MTAYNILINNVKQKRIKFYFVLSNTRSNSTTLTLALSQAPEIDRQINMPFFFETALNHEFNSKDLKPDALSAEMVANRINEIINPMLQSDKTLSIIIHEHFDYLTSDEHLNLLRELGNNFIFCFRDPKIQFLSHILASTNYFLIKNPSINNKKVFSYSDLLYLLHVFKNDSDNFSDKFNEIVKLKGIELNKFDESDDRKFFNDDFDSYIKTNFNTDSVDMTNSKFDLIKEKFNFLLNLQKNELEVCWINTLNTFNFLNSNVKVDKPNIIMIDGDNLVRNPEVRLKTIIDRIDGLSFTKDMIDNWKKFTGKDFVCFASRSIFSGSTNNWNGECQNSNKIKIRNDERAFLTSDLFMEDFNLVLNRAQEVYNFFYPNFIS